MAETAIGAGLFPANTETELVGGLEPSPADKKRGESTTDATCAGAPAEAATADCAPNGGAVGYTGAQNNPAEDTAASQPDPIFDFKNNLSSTSSEPNTLQKGLVGDLHGSIFKRL